MLFGTWLVIFFPFIFVPLYIRFKNLRYCFGDEGVYDVVGVADSH